MNILVSACLLGVNCRYNGEGKLHESILKLMDQHTLIPICPETLGGLSTPRLPSEKIGDKVITKDSTDVTEQFQKGAREVLKLAKLYQCKYAILKEKSPSCGAGKIYDGTFTGVLIEGNGVTTELLEKNGIQVIGETQIDKFKDSIS